MFPPLLMFPPCACMISFLGLQMPQPPKRVVTDECSSSGTLRGFTDAQAEDLKEQMKLLEQRYAHLQGQVTQSLQPFPIPPGPWGAVTPCTFKPAPHSILCTTSYLGAGPLSILSTTMYLRCLALSSNSHDHV